MPDATCTPLRGPKSALVLARDAQSEETDALHETDGLLRQMNLHIRPVIGLAPRCRLVSVDKDAVPLMQVKSAAKY